MKITIDHNIYQAIPEFNILGFSFSFFDVDYDLIKKDLQEIKIEENVLEIKNIQDVRTLYKKMGLDPSHTRCAQEALIRRIQRNNLSYISPMVDFGNLLSIKLIRSVCIADFNLIDNIYITIGKKGERIDAIGRNMINAENLIVYKDSQGIFGSTSSDAKRTMVTKNTTNYLILIILFTEEENDEQIFNDLINKYFKNSKITKLKCEVK